MLCVCRQVVQKLKEFAESKKVRMGAKPSLRDLSVLMKQAPQYQKELGHYSAHFSIAESCMTMFNKHVSKLCRAEQVCSFYWPYLHRCVQSVGLLTLPDRYVRSVGLLTIPVVSFLVVSSLQVSFVPGKVREFLTWNFCVQKKSSWKRLSWKAQDSQVVEFWCS